jgi:predicted DNA-binding transcriptional regulator YafY
VVRADRLVSLMLLLRQRGQLTAETLARELEVSTRTVLRDIEALSAAGIPVYTERGRHGGFALLPGFRADLTGLSHDETLALLTAASARGEQVFGLGTALSSAIRKVVDALPDDHRITASDAAQRLLVEPAADLLSRRQGAGIVPDTTMLVIRRAVVTGHRLRIHYAAQDASPQWRTVDPIGLVTVRDRVYLLATRDGENRTYRLSRVLAAEELAESAQRDDEVDLDQIWKERCAQFLSDDHIAVQVRVAPGWREELLTNAVAVRAEEPDADGWSRLNVTFESLRHAVWAVWELGTDAEALSPHTLRVALGRRAAAMTALYDDVADHGPVRSVQRAQERGNASQE